VRRRDLLKTTALGALLGPKLAFGENAQGAAAPPASANDRLGIGMIGVGNFGTANLRQFLRHPDAEVVAICDVFSPSLDKAVELAGGKAKRYGDYRRLLEDKDVDAVVITTPEHWHALMCIDACEAGKDVYVEKPVAHHIRDGRLMVDAARRHNRVVQVGTQQRSGAHFQRAVKYVQDGRIGDVSYATCWTHFPPPAPRPPVSGGPPPGMDWDMWLGPAPKLPYDEVWNVGRRGYWDFWGGQLTEWGSHLVDIVLWAMNVQAPERVVAVGGRFHKKEGEIPDTLQVTFQYPKFAFHYSVLNHNTYGLNGDVGAARFGSYGMQFHGTKGTLFIDRGTFRVTPQPLRQEEPNQMPASSPPDMRAPGFYYTTEILAEQSDSSLQHEPHVRNFLDSVKSRKRAIADIEDGHHANTACRLGNIAYRLGRSVRWDAAKEQVVGDAEANRLAVGAYRDPWKPKGL
jgi:predicted dehydrogenase